MNIIFGICIALSAFCFIYYGIITSYAGFGTAFAWFWILAGVGSLVLGFIIRYIMKQGIRVPNVIRYLTIAVFTLGLCCFLLLEGILIYYSGKKADPGADYLIVLGAQVRGTTITKSLKKRLDTALDYLYTNPDTIVIVSGGQGTGEDISEAEAMSNYLKSKGINEARIRIEDQSRNTSENIANSSKLIKGKDSTVVIVTNGFHVFRSVSIARKYGFQMVQGLAAPSDRILTINYYIREAAGVLKDFLYGNL